MKKKIVLYLSILMISFSIMICNQLPVEAVSTNDTNVMKDDNEEVSTESIVGEQPSDESTSQNETETSADTVISNVEGELPNNEVLITNDANTSDAVANDSVGAEVTNDDSLSKNGTENAVGVTSTVASDSVYASFIVDNITYIPLSDSTVKIDSASTSFGAVTIPSTVSYNGVTYTVTTIGYKAFYNCSGITSVIMPDTIIEIETGVYDTTAWKYFGAFANCKNLTEVEFSSNLIKIGKFAFSQCSSLQNVSLPEKIEIIEDEAFSYCSSINAIDLPLSVKTVGQCAFTGTSLITFTITKNCTNFHVLALSNISTLKAIYVEDGNSKYSSDDGVLYTIGYDSLISYPQNKDTSSYTMVSNAQSIFIYAFSKTNNLNSLTISKDLTEIETGAFQFSSVQEFNTPSDCNNYMAKDGVLYSKDGKTLLAYPTSKTDTIFFIPSGVTTVGRDQDYIWDGSKYLQELYVPASVTDFNTIMWNSPNLKKVIFAKNINISKIPGWCFQDCSSLESICIPDSVTSLAQDFYGNTFLDCNNLKSIYIGNNSNLYSWSDYGTQTLMGCPNLTVYAYGNNNNISNFASTFNVKYTDVTSYAGKTLGMTFDDTYLKLNQGEEYQLNLTVFPSTATKPVVSYTSSDPSIATVTGDGRVQIVGAGVCYVTCEAGDGSGEYTRCLIEAKKAIQDVSVTLSNVTFQYDGTEKKPAVSISGLIEGTDYTLEYQGNVNLGTATVTITGIGDYAGSIITKTFKIEKANIENAVVSGIVNKSYTGSDVTQPDLKVMIGTTCLSSGTDYDVTNKNNRNIGTATIIITGKGNYTGQITKTFKIEKTNIVNAVVSGISDKSYTGKEITQPDLKVTIGTVLLTAGTDYTLSYENNKNLGIATVTITGLYNFDGSINKTFEISVTNGYTYTVGSLNYKITDANTNGNGTVTVTGTSTSKSKWKKLSVGKTVEIGGKSFSITGIGNKAFKGYTSLKTVTIGNNVTTIGKEAFSGCGKITKVTVGTGLKTIGSKAFYNLKKLKTLKISSTKLKSVGSNAIKNVNNKCTIDVKSKKVKAYKKLFKSKTGYVKTIKIK